MADRKETEADLAVAVLEMLRLGDANSQAKQQRPPELAGETRQQVWVRYRDARKRVKKMAEDLVGAYVDG